MPFGAETDELGGTCFRLWGPAACTVELIIGSQPARALQLMPRWFELQLADVGAGAHHRFALDGGPQVPDQASRVQHDDVHGASEVVDPTAFEWLDEAWCAGRGQRWRSTSCTRAHSLLMATFPGSLSSSTIVANSA